jgi:hypothetical protein
VTRARISTTSGCTSTRRSPLLAEGEEADLTDGELIRVAPQLRRQLVNRGPGRLVLLALGGEGGHQGRDREAFVSWDQDVGAPPRDVPLPGDLGDSERR